MLELNKKAAEFIKSNADMLANEILKSQFEIQKELKTRYNKEQINHCLHDIKYHMSYLAESISYSKPELFYHYLKWAKTLFASLNISEEDLAVNLSVSADALNRIMPSDIKNIPGAYLRGGLEFLKDTSIELPSFIDEEKDLGSSCKQYLGYLIDNNKAAASKLVMDLIRQGVRIKKIYIDIFQMSQYELGRLWQSGKINVAQEHYCTAATQLIMSQLYPYIFKTEKGKHVFVGTCVSGEMHEIGIRMLSDLLELDGWNTLYLGANVPDRSIVKILVDNKADVLGISATMTFHLSKVEELIKAVRQSESTGDIKILVGGYVFNNNSELWKQIGADGFAADVEGSIVKINSIANRS